MTTLYKVMGHDGHEYPQVDQDTVRKWYLEGRVNRDTLVFVEFRQQWARLADVFDVSHWQRPTTPPISSAMERPATPRPSPTPGHALEPAKTTAVAHEQSLPKRVEEKPSTTTPVPLKPKLQPEPEPDMDRNPAYVTAGWLLIAFALGRFLLAAVAPSKPDALTTAVAMLFWDLTSGAGLLRTQGLLKIRPNGWRIFVMVRLIFGALALYGAGAGKAHFATDLQLLQNGPALLALFCLLAFRPQSRTLRVGFAALWTITPIVLALQAGGFPPALRLAQEAQVRDVAIERRDFLDSDSGLKITLPPGWYFLPNKSPFLNAPNAKAVIAYPRCQLFGIVATEFLSGKKLPKDRTPLEQYSENLKAQVRKTYPTAVFATEAVVGLGMPAERLGVVATDKGQDVVGFLTAFDDGYNFHLLYAYCPAAEQHRASLAFRELEAHVVSTKTLQDRAKEAAAIMAAKLPYFNSDAAEAFGRFLISHRLSAEEATLFSIELGARADSYLPAEEKVESTSIMMQALSALPEADLTTLQVYLQKHQAGEKLTSAEVEKVASLMVAAMGKLPTWMRERYKYLNSKGCILALADQ